MNWFHTDIRKPTLNFYFLSSPFTSKSWCQDAKFQDECWIGKSYEMYPRSENQRSYKVLILHQTRFFDERSHLQLLNVEPFVCWLVGEIKQPSLSRKKVNRCRNGHFHTWESIGGRSVNYIVLLHNYKQSLCMNDLPNDFNSNGGILIHKGRYQMKSP